VLESAAGLVEIVDAQQTHAANASVEPTGDSGEQRPQMQGPGGRRGEAPASDRGARIQR
jgi:hypothetical protein